MSHPPEHHRFVLMEIPELIHKTVLDCGCGLGIWGYSMRSEPQLGGDKAYIVGLDVHKPYLAFCKKFNVYDALVLADGSMLPFKNVAFDVVLACEVIEHLPKKIGLRFLEEIERVCRKQVILSTPNGFWLQRASDVADIKSEEHRSGWTVANFKGRRYNVHGIGFKWARLHWMRSRAVYGFFFYFFTPISYIIPYLGEFLVVAKDVSVAKCANNG